MVVGTQAGSKLDISCSKYLVKGESCIFKAAIQDRMETILYKTAATGIFSTHLRWRTEKCHVPEAVQTFTDSENLSKQQNLSAFTHYVQRDLAVCPVLAPGPHCQREHGGHRAATVTQINATPCSAVGHCHCEQHHGGVIANVFLDSAILFAQIDTVLGAVAGFHLRLWGCFQVSSQSQLTI